MPALWLLAWLWLLAPIHGVGAQPLKPVPPLNARVIDQTGTLGAGQRAALEARLAGLEAETGSQLAVLLIDSTAPEAIEAYALRVVEAWQLGRADIDDGALILVATQDRRLRIEVGYGLEGAIPDARAKQIIAEIMQPRFREGDFAGGLDAAVDAMATLIRGEELPAPVVPEATPDLFALLPVILIVTLLLGGPLRSALGTLPGSLATAAIAGGLVWLLVAVLGSALLAGALTFVINLLGVAGPGSWSSGGGFGGGYGRGGFGGGRGGFGGGGFGGGGGGFGGGGASGGW